MYSLITLINLFSNYDQTTLAITNRNFITFTTSLNLLKITILSMRATNSVTHFCRIIKKIFYDFIPDITKLFVNNISIKASKTKYNKKKFFLNIKRYIYKHLVNVDKILLNFKLAGATINMAKLH